MSPEYKFNHTRGPWTVEKLPDSNSFFIHHYTKGNEDCLAVVMSRFDAALIAAAPDLLLAVKMCRDYLNGDFADNEFPYKMIKSIKNSIEKAEGKS